MTCNKYVNRICNNLEALSNINSNNTNNSYLAKIRIMLNRYRMRILRPIRKLPILLHEKYSNFLIKITLTSSKWLLRLRNYNIKIIKRLIKAAEIAITIMNQKIPRSRSRESLRCRRIHRIKWYPTMKMEMEQLNRRQKRDDLTRRGINRNMNRMIK